MVGAQQGSTSHCQGSLVFSLLDSMLWQECLSAKLHLGSIGSLFHFCEPKLALSVSYSFRHRELHC
jgi:hypothetical protein